MVTKTNEQALEAAIEKALTGTCLEDLAGVVQEDPTPYGGDLPFYIGYADDFDPIHAIDTKRFWSFLESTQSEELEKLQRSSDWQLKDPATLRPPREERRSLLSILRKGLEVEDAHFTMLYQLPQASSSKTVRENFLKNQFSVSRQIRYNNDNQKQEVDMVIFLNGLPLATLELKNPWTGQNARVHGIKQYKTDRDQRQPLAAVWPMPRALRR